MDLALATGRGPAVVTDLDGRGPLVRDEDVVQFGRRDAAEADAGRQPTHRGHRHHRDRPGTSGGREPRKPPSDALEVVRPELDGFWVHLDCDALDDALMPAVDYRLPGGLSWDELETVLRLAVARSRVGIEVTIFNPASTPNWSYHAGARSLSRRRPRRRRATTAAPPLMSVPRPTERGNDRDRPTRTDANTTVGSFRSPGASRWHSDGHLESHAIGEMMAIRERERCRRVGIARRSRPPRSHHPPVLSFPSCLSWYQPGVDNPPEAARDELPSHRNLSTPMSGFDPGRLARGDVMAGHVDETPSAASPGWRPVTTTSRSASPVLTRGEGGRSPRQHLSHRLDDQADRRRRRPGPRRGVPAAPRRPVDDLLPELADRRVLVDPEAVDGDTVPAHRPITVRDVLTFRLGLGMDFPRRGRSRSSKR